MYSFVVNFSFMMSFPIILKNSFIIVCLKVNNCSRERTRTADLTGLVTSIF